MKHFRDFEIKADSYLMNKDIAINNYIQYMLCRTQSMFVYENLPDTIPADILELYLQTKGHCFITELDGKIYALSGTLGGEIDEYYRFTEYVVSNPALKLSKNFNIKKDGILVKNDTMELGLIPLLARYSVLIIENAISMRNATINARILTIISAPDERTKQSAELYLKKIENGENSVIGENPFFNGVRSQSANSAFGKTIEQLIALHQYIKASMFNEIGLDANYNMKKERINSQEAQLSDDFLLPFIDNMITNRRQAIEKINEKYGFDISIRFNSTWLTNELENMKQQEIYAMPPENISDSESLETRQSENEIVDVEKSAIDEMTAEIDSLETRQEENNNERNNQI